MARFCARPFQQQGQVAKWIAERSHRRAGVSAVVISTLKKGMRAPSTARLDGTATFPAAEKYPVAGGSLISRPDVGRKPCSGGAEHVIEIERKDCRGRSVHAQSSRQASAAQSLDERAV